MKKESSLSPRSKRRIRGRQGVGLGGLVGVVEVGTVAAVVGYGGAFWIVP